MLDAWYGMCPEVISYAHIPDWVDAQFLILWQIPVDCDLVTGASTPATYSNGRSNKSKRKSFKNIKVTKDEIGEDD